MPIENQCFTKLGNVVKKEYLYDMKKERKKRVAIYARVSTYDKGQDPETQLLQLREYVERRGFDLVREYVDYASGTSEQREEYKKMIDQVRKRKIDVVLVWRYDRFARSTQALVNALNEFRSLRVDFISYQENIDTTTPQGEMIFNIMASLAQFESSLISERVKAGMARAKAQGKRISRPPLTTSIRLQIAQMYEQNISINQISKKLGISYGSAWNYVQRLK
jgi:DNA invertase Pin-like site-specific DNA recombinase